jgi:hypothetical protein
MSTNERPLQRPNRLSLDHEAEMSLRYGDLPSRPAFGSEEERRAAWFYHRERLLMHCQGGGRPAGWWDYESPIRRPRNHNYQEAALYEAGLLAASEVDELVATWRSAFERAQDPRFMFCIGYAKPGDRVTTWLSGEAAKRAHLKWAGVPRALIRKWTAEHRRRGKTIRKLETAAAEQPEPAA